MPNGMFRVKIGQEDYSAMINKIIESVSNAEPKDRLECAKAFIDLVNAIAFTAKNWQKWKHLRFLNAITEDEYCDLLWQLTNVVVKLLELDRDLTKRKEKEVCPSPVISVEREDEAGQAEAAYLI